MLYYLQLLDTDPRVTKQGESLIEVTQPNIDQTNQTRSVTRNIDKIQSKQGEVGVRSSGEKQQRGGAKRSSKEEEQREAAKRSRVELCRTWVREESRTKSY
jgi:hypothetical protein